MKRIVVGLSLFLAASLTFSHYFVVHEIQNPQPIVDATVTDSFWRCVDSSGTQIGGRYASETAAVNGCGSDAADDDGNYFIEVVSLEQSTVRTRTHEIRGSTQLRVSEADAQLIVSGGSSGGGQPPGGEPDAGSMSVSVEIEYIDSSGNLQTTTVSDGVTSISGTAPFLVHIDASASRSTETDGDEEHEAFIPQTSGTDQGIGYLINFGEALGETWSVTGRSKDTARGPPLWGRAYTNVGTNTTCVYGKDSAGSEDSVCWDVVVSDPLSGATNIPVSDGSWPTWASSTNYTLDAGGDYSSFGAINGLNGLHNVVIAKTGEGADPIVSAWYADFGRGGASDGTTRTRHVRTLDLDIGVAGFTGARGPLYFGNVGGDVGGIADGPTKFIWSSVSSEADHNAIVYPRGWFLQDAGVSYASNAPDSDNYTFITDPVAHMHVTNHTFVNDASGATQHNVRGTWWKSSFRDSLFYNTAVHQVFFNIYGNDVNYTGDGDYSEWKDGDPVGDHASGDLYGYAAWMSFLEGVILGASGDTRPNALVAFSPENNDIGSPDQMNYLIGMENCSTYRDNGDLGNVFDGGAYTGHYVFQIGCVDGSDAALNTGPTSFEPNRLPGGNGGAYDGPEVIISSNPRPVPSGG